MKTERSPTLKIIDTFIRQQLKDLLARLSDGNIALFKRMYSPNDMELHIDSVVDKMPADKLDWAIEQCENTLRKNDKTITKKTASIELTNIKMSDGWYSLAVELGMSEDMIYKVFEHGEFGNIKIIVDEELKIVGGYVIPCGK